MLKPATEQMLDKLSAADWFVAVGQRLDAKVIHVASWDEAIASCKAHGWECCQNEMLNLVRDGPCQKDRARYNQWNDIVRELKVRFMPIVNERCDRVVKANRLPKVFMDCVNWDVLGLLMECEYADLTDSRWFHTLGDWFLRGRFPCGWDGEFPRGRLIVY